MKKTPVSLICGIASILVTIILYLAILGNVFAQIICFITLIGVVIAEAIVTFLAYFCNGEPRKVGATIFAGLMIPVSITLSVVYILNFPRGYALYLAYYVAALVVILGITLIIWNFSGNRSAENAVLQNAKNNMIGLRKLVKCALAKTTAPQVKKDLEKIEEKLHFSNDAVITDVDSNIRRLLIELDNNIANEGYNPQPIMDEIAKEIDRRNIMTKPTV